MSLLVVGELITSLDQEFKIAINKNIAVERIRPHLYIAQPDGLINGGLKLSIIDSTGSIYHDSLTQDLTEIRNSGSSKLNDKFYHGYVSFIFPDSVILNSGTYFLRLEGVNGYTYSQDNYIGWIKEHEDITVPTYGIVYEAGNRPYSFEVFSYQMR